MLERIKKDGIWKYVTSEVRDWSPIHFLFDAFVTCLIAYGFALIVSVNWYQLIVLGLLMFGTIATGSVVVRDFRRPQKQAAAPGAVDVIRVQLTNYAKDAPDEDSIEFDEWRKMVAAYLRASLKFEVGHEFNLLADEKNPRACRHFLRGLAASVNQSDLRKSSDTDGW